MASPVFERLEGGERSRCETPAIGREDLDGVVARLEAVIGPGTPAASFADRHHLAEDLDAVTLPDVLEKSFAKAGELRVRVRGLAGEERIARLRASDDVVVDDA